jgi:hypothetical protein
MTEQEFHKASYNEIGQTVMSPEETQDKIAQLGRGEWLKVELRN